MCIVSVWQLYGIDISKDSDSTHIPVKSRWPEAMGTRAGSGLPARDVGGVCYPAEADCYMYTT